MKHALHLVNSEIIIADHRPLAGCHPPVLARWVQNMPFCTFSVELQTWKWCRLNQRSMYTLPRICVFCYLVATRAESMNIEIKELFRGRTSVTFFITIGAEKLSLSVQRRFGGWGVFIIRTNVTSGRGRFRRDTWTWSIFFAVFFGLVRVGRLGFFISGSLFFWMISLLLLARRFTRLLRHGSRSGYNQKDAFLKPLLCPSPSELQYPLSLVLRLPAEGSSRKPPCASAIQNNSEM